MACTTNTADALFSIIEKSNGDEAILKSKLDRFVYDNAITTFEVLRAVVESEDLKTTYCFAGFSEEDYDIQVKQYLKTKIESQKVDSNTSFFNNESKLDEQYEVQERQDNKKSYLFGAFDTYNDYRDYLGYIDSELRNIAVRDNETGKLILGNNARLQQSIQHKLLTIAKELQNDLLQSHMYGTEIKELNAADYKLETIEGFNNYMYRFLNIIKDCEKYKQLLGKKIYRQYILLSRFDSSLKEVYKSDIKIPSGYFNTFSDNKVYSFSGENKLSAGWHNEEDYDDFVEISDIIPKHIECLNTYTLSMNGDTLNAVKNHNATLDFNKFVESVNFLSRLVYSKNPNIILDTEINPDFKSRVRDLFNYANYGDKNLIWDTYLEGKTVKDLICSLNDDRMVLMPILLEYLFGTQQIEDENNNNINIHYNPTLTKAIFNSGYTTTEYLYSVYQGIYNLNEGSTSYFREEVDLQDSKDIKGNSIVRAINQTLSSITYQKYVRYLYDDDSKTVKRIELKPKAINYEENAFTRHLNGMHRANNPTLNITYDEFEELKKTLEDSKFKEISCSLFPQNSGIKFEIGKQDGTIVYRISFSDNNGQHSYLFQINKFLTYNGKETKLNIINMNALLKKLEPIIERILPINYNENFKTRINDDASSYKTYLTQLVFSVLGHKFTNELINLSNTDEDKKRLRTTGSKFSSDKDVKSSLQPFIPNNQSVSVSNIKTRKDDFQLELFTKQVSTQFSSIVALNTRSSNKAMSIMVEDGAKKQLNSNKLSSAGNKSLELAQESKSKESNPNYNLVLYELFVGGAVLRDFTDSQGTVTKATKFNSYEHLVSNFITDYLGGFNREQHTIGIAGAVVSDKPYIYRILCDLGTKLKYYIDKQGNLVKGVSSQRPAVTLQDILQSKDSTKLIQQLTKTELGLYYGKQYQFVQNQIQLINNYLVNKPNLILDILTQKLNLNKKESQVMQPMISQISFDYFNDFANFNRMTSEEGIKEYLGFREQTNNNSFWEPFSGEKAFHDGTLQANINSIREKLKLSNLEFRQDILHELSLKIPELQFIDNLVAYFDKNGDIHVNPLLIDNNIRYHSEYAEEIIENLSEEFKSKYWSEVGNIDLYGDKYFNEARSHCISDLIRSNYKINSYSDELFTTSETEEDGSRKKDKNAIDWIKLVAKPDVFLKGSLMYAAVLKYKEEGSDETQIHGLSDTKSLETFQPYQALQRLVNLDNKNIVEILANQNITKDEVTISNPKFDIQKVINALNNETIRSLIDRMLYKEAIKRGLQSIVDSETRLSYANKLGLFENVEELDPIANEYTSKDVSQDTKRAWAISKVFDTIFNELISDPNYDIEQIYNEFIELLQTNGFYNENTIKVKNSILNTSNSIEIDYNKLITDYNQISLLMNEEHLNMTVGSYLNHPIKGSDLDNLTQKCIGAQVKRNVTFSATKHQYALNNLNGISKQLRIAIIENVEDEVFNITGFEVGKNKVPTWPTDDGATYVYGAMGILENNSLESSKVGVDKKQFGAMVNPESGTGFILKTAGFTLTCDRIRTSKFRQILNKKMGSVPWLEAGETFNGEQFVDFTKDYQGNDIQFADLNIIYDEPVLDTKTGELVHTYYKVTNVRIEKTENGVKTIISRQKYIPNEFGVCNSECRVNSEDKILDSPINSNYDLWKEVLGGMYSCEEQMIDGQLQFSYHTCNKSNELLAYFMNNVGESKVPSTKNVSHLSQSTLRQIMKEKMIAYACTEGAVKQGASNRNQIRHVWDEDIPLTTMTLLATDLGVQLDAEHSVEDSAVSLMTQVMNAAAARGYSLEKGNEIYDALYKITQLAIRDCLQGIISDDPILKEKAEEKIAEIIISSLKKSSSSDSNLLQTITNGIRSLKFNEKKLDYLKNNIPIDDPSILRKILSNLTVSFQKTAVKLKFPGNQLVLVPSNNHMLLFDGKTLEEYGGDYDKMAEYLYRLQDSKDEITDEPYLPEITTTADIVLGKTYRYIEDDVEKILNIKNPWVYWQFKTLFNSGKISNVKEKLAAYVNGKLEAFGTELGCANFIFKDTSGTKYQIWDLDCVRKKWNLEAAKAPKEQLLEAQDEIQKQLQILGDTHDGDIVKIYNEENPDQPIEIKIDRLSVKHVPYEAILPKTFKDKFDLSTEDSLSKIKGDRNFFLKKALKKVKTSAILAGFNIDKINESEAICDISLVGTNYTRNFLYYKNIQDFTNFPPDYYELNLTGHYVNKNGKLFRIDALTGDIMYQIPSKEQDGFLVPDIRIIKDSKGSEVIITNDINFFLNQKKHQYINFYPRQTQDEQRITTMIESLKLSKIKAIRHFIKNLQSQSKSRNQKSVFSAYNDLTTEYYSNIRDIFEKGLNYQINISDYEKLIRSLVYTSSNQYGSFIDSLNFIASRTPAQCQQSFMSMQTVAFDTSEQNSAYVSRWQLWLQGSDFDIDKVNIITHNINNGYMKKWSPFQKYNLGEQYTMTSNELPLPTGKQITRPNDNGKAIESLHGYNELYNLFLSISNIKQPSLYGNKEIDNLLKAMAQITQSSMDANAEFEELIQYPEIRDYISQFYDIENTDINTILSDKEVIDYITSIQNTSVFAYYFSRLLKDIGISDLNYDASDEITQKIIDLVNEHNSYFDGLEESDQIEAMQNFISKRIWQISINPINWVQGQTPVDGVTGPWKTLADTQPLAKDTARYINKSIVNTFQQLILTLEGKENVSIAANSLKVFEAISQYIYTQLNNASEIELQELFFELIINGEKIHSVANAWCNSEKMHELEQNFPEIAEILKTIDQHTDAFTELSALLSLAADNAKDPTLSKINGGPNMIGLYTSGIMFGIKKDTLVKIINSKTGVLISNLLSGNKFQNDYSFTSFDTVLDYIDHGPFDSSSLICNIFRDVLGIEKQKDFNFIEYFGSHSNPNGVILGKKLINIIYKLIHKPKELLDSDFLLSAYEENQIRDNQPDSFLGTWTDRDTIKRVLSYFSDLYNNEEFSAFTSDNNSYTVKTFINQMYDWYDALDTVIHDKREVPTVIKEIQDDIEVEVEKLIPKEFYYDIRTLIKLNAECQNVSFFTKLNQGYANSIEEQIAFVASFEQLLEQAYDKASTKKKQSDEVIIPFTLLEQANLNLVGEDSLPKDIHGNILPYTSFDYFMNGKIVQLDVSAYRQNPDSMDIIKRLPGIIIEQDAGETKYNIAYQNLIIGAYNSIKTAVNPFSVVLNVGHYTGYLEGMYTAYKSSQEISAVYKGTTKYISRVCRDLKIRKSAEKEQAIKNLINYFHRIRNEYFYVDSLENFAFNCPSYIINGDINGETQTLSLIKNVNRQYFKTLIEDEILDRLKEKYQDNLFIQSLHLETDNHTPNHNIQTLIKSNITTVPTTLHEITEFQAAKADLAKLQYEQFGGQNIIALLYLYNLIATDNLSIPGSITPFFEDIRSNRENGFINQYNDYIINFSKTHIFDLFGLDRFENIEDALKYCAPIVNIMSRGNKYTYVYVRDSDHKKYDLYKRESISSENNAAIMDQGIEIEIEEKPSYFQKNNATTKKRYYKQGTFEFRDVDAVMVELPEQIAEEGIKYKEVITDNITSQSSKIKNSNYSSIRFINKNKLVITKKDGTAFTIHKSHKLEQTDVVRLFKNIISSNQVDIKQLENLIGRLDSLEKEKKCN